MKEDHWFIRLLFSVPNFPSKFSLDMCFWLRRTFGRNESSISESFGWIQHYSHELQHCKILLRFVNNMYALYPFMPKIDFQNYPQLRRTVDRDLETRKCELKTHSKQRILCCALQCQNNMKLVYGSSVSVQTPNKLLGRISKSSKSSTH